MNRPALGALEFAQAIPDQVFGNQVLVVPVCGWLTGNSAAAECVMVEIDGAAAGNLRLDEPVPPRLFRREDLGAVSAKGFAGELRLEARESGFEHVVKLTLVTRDNDLWQVSVHTVKRAALETANIEGRSLAPRIAICMAVYNPDPAAFAVQVRSIVEQTAGDWICIVNDDGSDVDRAAMIRETIAVDSRFCYFRNESNLGFYRNFEAALARVPAGIEFIALSDQDDRWYVDKLERLVGALRDDALLAYSDMRIVSDDGDELSSSYWGYRRNNYDDINLMLVANTVTGAACMMRRQLLDVLLPFPPRVGEAFHDHWIACSALAYGRISYVDHPLYDYVQHGEAVIGHCGFEDSRTVGKSRRRGWSSRFRPAGMRAVVSRFMGAGQAVYWHECRRIESLCRNLLARDIVRPEQRGALTAYGRGLRSAGWLLWLNLRTRGSARLTDNAERRLARGYVVHGMLRAMHRLT